MAKVGDDGANVYPAMIADAAEKGAISKGIIYRVYKHLQQGIESGHFPVKKNMPKIGGFRSFATAKWTISGFEVMLWLKKGFGFACDWDFAKKNNFLHSASDFKWLIKRKVTRHSYLSAAKLQICDKAGNREGL